MSRDPLSLKMWVRAAQLVLFLALILGIILLGPTLAFFIAAHIVFLIMVVWSLRRP